jgi:AcrR family transcriptional regulator
MATREQGGRKARGAVKAGPTGPTKAGAAKAATVKAAAAKAGERSTRARRPKTRDRLLNSAEQLFALHGLESVSIRDITESADANAAAIHYHFGSKADLVAAIFHRRATTLGQRRSELLSELESREHVDLWDLAEAMVQPTAELAADEDGGRYYVAFLTALGGNPDLIHVVMDAYEADTQRIQKVLVQVTPDLPPDVRMLRYAIVRDLINRVLGQPDGQLKQWLSQQNPAAYADIEGRLVDIVVGIFQAPVTKRRQRRRS